MSSEVLVDEFSRRCHGMGLVDSEGLTPADALIGVSEFLSENSDPFTAFFFVDRSLVADEEFSSLLGFLLANNLAWVGFSGDIAYIEVVSEPARRLLYWLDAVDGGLEGGKADDYVDEAIIEETKRTQSLSEALSGHASCTLSVGATSGRTLITDGNDVAPVVGVSLSSAVSFIRSQGYHIRGTNLPASLCDAVSAYYPDDLGIPVLGEFADDGFFLEVYR